MHAQVCVTLRKADERSVLDPGAFTKDAEASWAVRPPC